MARILIIDDDKECLVQLNMLLTHVGHEVFPLLRADKVLNELQNANPDLVITDIVMPGVMGGTVYEAIRKQVGPYLPIIVSSGTHMRLKPVNDPFLDYCPKPVDYDVLLASVNRLLAASREVGMKQIAEDLD
jgi:DNA-binding NtrC family response regulator